MFRFQDNFHTYCKCIAFLEEKTGFCIHGVKLDSLFIGRGSRVFSAILDKRHGLDMAAFATVQCV